MKQYIGLKTSARMKSELVFKDDAMQSLLIAVKKSIITFWVDDYTYQASALSFLTILAIVPFLSIITFAIKLSGKYDWILNETTKFIYANFLPASGNIIEQHLKYFATSASKLPFIAIIFFFVTILMHINTLERTLNHIWNVRAYRSLFNKCVSWSALLIFPFLIALSTIANNFINLIFRNNLLSQFFLALSVFILQVIVFTMLYVLVPNVRLKFKNALYGGILAGILFNLLKFFFVFYVFYFTKFTAIYGSLAVIPIFFTWIYFTWCTFLFGAIYIHKRR